MNDYINKIIQADCCKAMKSLPDNSIDAIITDPPYGLSKQPDMKKVLSNWNKGNKYNHNSNGFMGKNWDSFVPHPEIWQEAYRIIKPNGIIAAFSGTRTQDLSILSMKIAANNYQKITGTPIHYINNFYYIYGSDFPKSLNIEKALRKKSQNELAELWKGYGTGLKPAYEPVIMFRKGNNNLPIYPDNVNFYYTSKASKKERNQGCQNLYWYENKLIGKSEYNQIKSNNIPNVYKGNIHATVKPISIMEKLIECTGLKKGIVLDPFAGSGSTLIAAVNKGLQAIGFELEDSSMIIANCRLNEVLKK